MASGHNPWSVDDHAWSTVPGPRTLRDSRLLEDSMGTDGPQICLSATTPRVATSSLQLISAMEQLDECDASLSQLRIDHDLAQQQAECADLTHEDVVATRTADLSKLQLQLQRIVDHTSAIEAQLQKPCAASAIPVEYPTQRDFLALMRSLPESLPMAPAMVRDVKWAGSFDSTTVPLQRKVEDVTSLLARYRTFYESLQTLRTCLQTLQQLGKRA